MRFPLLFMFCFIACAASVAQIQPAQVFQKATAELNTKISGIDKQVANATPEIQSKIDAIEAPKADSLSVRVGIADDRHRQILANEVQAFAANAEKQERLYSILAVILICLSTGLALVGSIASFKQKTTAAGVIGLIVMGIVAGSNAYPVAPLANFYGNLKSEAQALVADCKLTNPYTETTYNSDVTQYKLLLLYQQKKPSFGKFENPANALKQEMQSVKIASNNADTARAAIHEIVGYASVQTNPSKNF